MSPPRRALLCLLSLAAISEHGFTAGAQVQISEAGLFLDGFETGNTIRWHTTITSGAAPEP